MNQTNVVCVSRTLGSGGEEIARAVADRLGLRYADGLVVERAAQLAGIHPALVADAEKTPGLLQRILGRLSEASDGPLAPSSNASTAYERLIVSVIREIAQEGNVVIFAHGASMRVAGLPGALRVLITGSPEKRAAQVAQDQALDEHMARDIVKESDEQRKFFFRRFYDVSEELPHHYDLIINTDFIPRAEAVEL